MEKIAEEIYDIVRQQIISGYPFLANAAYAVNGREIHENPGRIQSEHSDDVHPDNDRIQSEHTEHSVLYTDGIAVCYDSRKLIRAYQEEETLLVYTLLHILLHLLFLHPWGCNREFRHAPDRSDDTALWDFACDLAVESVIAEFLPDTYTDKQTAVFTKIKAHVQFFSAKTIYQYLKEAETAFSEEEISLFKKDSHDCWYGRQKGRNQNMDRSDQKKGGDPVSDLPSGLLEKQKPVIRTWLEISRKTLNEWKHFYQKNGQGSGSFMENLMYTNRTTYDYRQFLRQFAAYRENIRINEEEFDYLYYMYGLELYHNLPLIEPLEYKTENRIQDFVIALDTSGSCSGKLLQEFVNRTFDILKSEETFHRQMNIHLLQCDSDITNIRIIHNSRDIKEAIQNFQVYGYGSTDFRPVFRYVDAMLENGTFTDLKGLIYFTDGHGTFPSKIPEYKTAFVFVEDGYTEPDVPAWAIRVVLSQAEIMNL